MSKKYNDKIIAIKKKLEFLEKPDQNIVESIKVYAEANDLIKECENDLNTILKEIKKINNKKNIKKNITTDIEKKINLIDNNIEKINNSSMELEKLVKLYNDSVEIINTIENSVSHLKIDVPVYSQKKLPETLKSIPITSPGSRFIQ